MLKSFSDRWVTWREKSATPPIIVLSFNRPHYLRQVLDSLRNQRPAIDARRVHLFQDGAVNAYSGKVYAKQSDIDACVEMFRVIFPRGHVHVSAKNIGICENFIRAETLAFVKLRAPVAYFFEDDLVLSPHYIEALDLIRAAVAGCQKVGYFNACGQYTASLAEQRANATRLIGMGHNWGFGLRRQHWLAMQPLLADYYAMVVGTDYRRRDRNKILDYWKARGFSEPAASQDYAKKASTRLLKAQLLSCFPSFGRYIGEQGTHFNPETYQRLGFDRAVVYDGRPEPVAFAP